MKATFYNLSCSSSGLIFSHNRRIQQRNSTVSLKQKGIGCVAMERDFLQGAVFNKEEADELMELGKLRSDKCKERKNGGVVELLECLEREAIMGEDHGRQPTDYNRRAQIFDKSSRLFQALKEENQQDNTHL